MHHACVQDREQCAKCMTPMAEWRAATARDLAGGGEGDEEEDEDDEPIVVPKRAPAALAAGSCVCVCVWALCLHAYDPPFAANRRSRRRVSKC